MKRDDYFEDRMKFKALLGKLEEVIQRDKENGIEFVDLTKDELKLPLRDLVIDLNYVYEIDH
jgi:hypothetical protein